MDALTIIALVLAAIGGYYGVKSKVKDSNISDLKDREVILEADKEATKKDREEERQKFQKELDDEKETRQKLHLENQKAISNLEGQLATYKEIPLQSIAESLQAIPKLVDSNQKILDTLQGSAKIAEKEQSDGGLLVKTKETNPLDVKPVEATK